jgi:hypothetical protein
MAACADRVAREYADLVAGGATAAQLCHTHRYYALAVAFKTTLLVALLYGMFALSARDLHGRPAARAYAVLGVSAGVSDKELRAAYREAARRTPSGPRRG